MVWKKTLETVPFFPSVWLFFRKQPPMVIDRAKSTWYWRLVISFRRNNQERATTMATCERTQYFFVKMTKARIYQTMEKWLHKMCFTIWDNKSDWILLFINTFYYLYCNCYLDVSNLFRLCLCFPITIPCNAVLHLPTRAYMQIRYPLNVLVPTLP